MHKIHTINKAQFYQSIGVTEENSHTRGKHFWLEKCASCGNFVRVTDRTQKDVYYLVNQKLVPLCTIHRPKRVPIAIWKIVKACEKFPVGKAGLVSENFDTKLYCQLREFIKKEKLNMKVVSRNKQLWIYNIDDVRGE